jgi:hypothetical protein
MIDTIREVKQLVEDQSPGEWSVEIGEVVVWRYWANSETVVYQQAGIADWIFGLIDANWIAERLLTIVSS